MKSTKRKSEIAESLSSKLHELIDSFEIVKGKSINKAVNDAAKALAKQISKKLKNLNTIANSEMEVLKSNVKSSLEKMSESPILAPKPPRKKRTTKPKVTAVSKEVTQKLATNADVIKKPRKPRTLKAKTPIAKTPEVEIPVKTVEAAIEVNKVEETPKTVEKAPRKARTVKAKAPVAKKKVTASAKSASVVKKKVVAKSTKPKTTLPLAKPSADTIVETKPSINSEAPKTEPETEVNIEAKPVERVKRAWVRKTPIVTTDTPKVAPLFKNKAKGVLVASTSDKPGRPYTPRKKKTESPK